MENSIHELNFIFRFPYARSVLARETSTRPARGHFECCARIIVADAKVEAMQLGDSGGHAEAKSRSWRPPALLRAIESLENAAALEWRDARSGCRETRTVGCPPAISATTFTAPPTGVNLIALSTRLPTASTRRSKSPATGSGAGASKVKRIDLASAKGWKRSNALAQTSLRSTSAKLPRLRPYSISEMRSSAVTVVIA